MNKDELLKLLNATSDSPVKINPHDRILIVDGLNLFMRNFAVLNYINQDGVHVGGLGGFLRSLGSLIHQNVPTEVYIVFDGIGSSTNRKNLLPEYKSNRGITKITNWETFENIDEENDAKIDQIIRLIQYLKCLPVKLISFDKVEADDIIAYLSQYTSTTKQSKCTIVSSDKDFLQLVDDNITVYSPMIKEFYTAQTVEEKFGLPPKNFILYKTLLGDNSDKVPGLKGLGPKKLFKFFPELSQQELSLEKLYDICESKYKENVMYSRFIFEYETLKKHYKLMDLCNPLLSDEEKKRIDNIVEKSVDVVKMPEFIKMYNEDGLGHILKNIEYWLRSTFSTLSSFK
jgi:DNA polymerase-1